MGVLMPLRSGQKLQSRYEVIHPLGQGGMGAVYLAKDGRLGNKHVAIKEFDPTALPPQDRQWAAGAFAQEAQMLAQLSHPALTTVTDYFAEQHLLYLVMEYVPGETLEQAWLRQSNRQFSAPQVIAWAKQLCSVLQYLHSQNPPLIFRDLKPGNIMVLPDGKLKLIDFGIARYFKQGQTRDTIALGTPGYAAPEQHGREQADARSDIYALGVVMHQLLTGHDPAITPFALPPIRTLSPATPVALSQVIEQALALDRTSRPSSAQAFHRLLLKAEVAPAPKDNVFWSTAPIFFALFIVGGGLLWGAILLFSSTSLRVAPPISPTLAAVSNAPAPTMEATAVVTVIVTVTTPAIETEATATPTNTPPEPTATTPPTPLPPATFLPPLANPSAQGLLFAPTGRLVFVSNRSGRDALYLIEFGNPTNLYQITNPDGRDWWPTWCGPNDLLFERADQGVSPAWQEIYRVSLSDLNRAEPITSNRLPQGSDRNGFPACSPNGRYLAFSSHDATATSSADFKIGVVDMTRQPWQFTLFGDGYSLAGAIAWSPDGEAISFMHRVGNRFAIYRLDPTTPSSPLNLTETYPGSSKYPTWSPDGRWIAFSCTHAPLEEQIWGLCVTPSDRSDVTLLLPDLQRGSEWDRAADQAFHAVTPSWSPDGRWLAFASNKDGDSDIYLYHVETGQVINLTENWPSKEMHPRWSP